ncbi:hypothetical protein [Photobacterium kishitanii]|uniref:hypothetical protein n=1 Tax=Photobacterium kishitanii TaxID=318456 RepID=UPI0007F92207|nr:hypothetical protein [Photobacterium kishitanii]OBU33864.1 hypothetical protein AYY23_13605 [Photobacterium kishitanii]PSW47128.1 hypothetical protein C0W66_19740 [Photobacterium kishitanii]
MEISRKLNQACNLALEEVLLKIGNRINSIELSQVMLKEDGSPKSGDLSLGLSLCSTGVYVLESPSGELVYVGQGGRKKSTTLNDRILQELRLFKKTANGSNGGTISKNIQSIDGICFKTKGEWRMYLSNYRLRVLHSNNWDISINLIEAFIIEAINPKYNIDK